MMVLYHLHNPTAPAFVITCTKCNLDIESGQGWRCETCPEYDICNACYQKDEGKNHPHKLTKNQSIDPNAQNKEAKQLRLSQVNLSHTMHHPRLLYSSARLVTWISWTCFAGEENARTPGSRFSVPVNPLPVSKLSQGQGTFPPWHPVQKARGRRLSYVYENVAASPASRPSMQRI